MAIAKMLKAAHGDPEAAVLLLGQWIADNPDTIKQGAVDAANSPEGQAAIAQAKQRASEEATKLVEGQSEEQREWLTRWKIVVKFLSTDGRGKKVTAMFKELDEDNSGNICTLLETIYNLLVL